MVTLTVRFGPWPKLLMLVAFLGLIVGLAIPFHSDKPNEWDDVYRASAALVRDGEDLYRQQPLYTYPPFMAWALIPFTHLERVPARSAWYAINMLSLLGMIWLGWRLVFPAGEVGGPTGRAVWFDRGRWLIFGFGLFLGLRPGTNSVLHHQTDLPLGLFLFMGLTAIRASLPYAGSILIGLAAAMKCTPLLFVVYFFWRKPRFAAVTLVAVSLGVNLLPHLTHPPVNGEVLVHTWYRAVVHRLMRPTTYPGSWNVDVTTNQSLAGSVNAWMRTSWSVAEGEFATHSIEPLLPAWAAKGCVYGLGLLFLAVTLWLCRRAERANALAGDGHAALFSSFLLIMLLMSPMSHKTHFTLLLLPAFVVGRRLWETRSLRLGVLTAGVLLLQVASLRLLSKTGAQILTWHGSQMFTTLLLLCATWFVLEDCLEGQEAPPKESEPTSEPSPATAPVPTATEADEDEEDEEEDDAPSQVPAAA